MIDTLLTELCHLLYEHRGSFTSEEYRQAMLHLKKMYMYTLPTAS